MAIYNAESSRVADPLGYLDVRYCAELVVTRVPRVVYTLLEILEGCYSAATVP